MSNVLSMYACHIDISTRDLDIPIPAKCLPIFVNIYLSFKVPSVAC